jgi:hypothetical protein
MAHLRSRRRLALAVPVVLSLTASLGFLPAAASAAPRTASAAQTAEGSELAYVVNTKTDHHTIKSTHPHASAELVKALLYAEADATPCTDPYDIDADGKIDAVCKGSTNRNGFYEWGTVDALKAVTK